MSKRRLAAAVLLALALSPGTFLRTPLPRERQSMQLVVQEVSDLPELVSSNGFTRQGVWQLESERIDFGGFSALLVLGGGTKLRAFSDRGKRLTFAPPGSTNAEEPHFGTVWQRGPLGNTVPDIEAATRNPENGDHWLAFESTHSVIRNSVASEYLASALPDAWQAWPENGGAEAMARLPDGRFLVLPERSSTGLLYPGDPTARVEPITFGFAIPDGYSATDMAALPDGRVLVLLRKMAWSVPPFAAAIAIADPRTLEEGASLDLDLLVQLDDIVPSENYEALAVAGMTDEGAVRLWLMSDDNIASFQRTLLVQLDWHGDSRLRKAHEKARGG